MTREQKKKMGSNKGELEQVKRKLDRILHVVESTDLDMDDASERILVSLQRREQLEAVL